MTNSKMLKTVPRFRLEVDVASILRPINSEHMNLQINFYLVSNKNQSLLDLLQSDGEVFGAIHDFFKLVVYQLDLSEQLDYARLLLQLHGLQASDLELLR